MLTGREFFFLACNKIGELLARDAAEQVDAETLPSIDFDFVALAALEDSGITIVGLEAA